jgi:hypothetical protein
MYVCRTPEEDQHQDLLLRKEKREEKRRLQRWAAQTLELSPQWMVSQNSGETVRFVATQPRRFKLPVLEPTVFDLGHVLDAIAWTIVHRRRPIPSDRWQGPPSSDRQRFVSDVVKHNYRSSICFEDKSINGHKFQALIDGPLCDVNEKRPQGPDRCVSNEPQGQGFA